MKFLWKIRQSPRSISRLGRARVALALCWALAPTAAGVAAGKDRAAEQFDTIILDGTIVDGSGLPPYRGDVGIVGDHIVAVGKLGRAQARAVVDARGLVVAPGFINIHSHAQPDAVASAVNMLTQGVTTEIANADGDGGVDIAKELEEFASRGLAENVGLYIGFNAAWTATVGEEDRRATAAEVAGMRSILDRNLAAGAWGVASGLDYKPAYFADADEVFAVLSAARRWRTNFPNHERLRPEEDYSSYKGMRETIDLAERGGVMPVITHIKTQGAEQGNAPAVIAMMDAAAARGAYTAADAYPYLAGHAGLSLLVPGWAHEGGRPAMLSRFADPGVRARIIVEAERAMRLRFGGPAGVRVLSTGQELTDAMRAWNVGAGEALVRLIEQEDYGAILTYGRESDLVAFLQYPNTSMACDCGATTGARIHPRNWGSFPRVLGHYVRDTRALTLADAIRKMTALPAATIGMSDRGYLAAGMKADITVFDPRTIADRATYTAPTLPSVGVRHVWVNGKLALRDGSPTGVQGGERLMRGDHMPSRPMAASSRARSLAGHATVASDGARYAVSYDLRQPVGARSARGRLRIGEGGRDWTVVRLGTIQIAPKWSSVTAVLRDHEGKLQPVMLTVDSFGSQPVIALSAKGRVATGPLAGAGRPQ